MEVFINNLPASSTVAQLTAFLEPLLDPFCTGAHRCEKRDRSPHGQLFFVNYNDGSTFLERYGQTSPRPRQWVLNPNATQLLYQGRLVYFSAGRKTPSPFLLRSIALEQKRKLQTMSGDSDGNTHNELVLASQSQSDSSELATRLITCGRWDYNGQTLIFAASSEVADKGTLTVGPARVTIDVPSKYRLEIFASSINSILLSQADLAVTLTLIEAPRVYKPPPMLISLTPNPKPQPWERLRGVPSMHLDTTSLCLVYRIALNDSASWPRLQRLHRLRGAGRVTYSSVPVRPDFTSFGNQLSLFNQALDYAKADLPFEVKYQVFRLLRNGYIGPSDGRLVLLARAADVVRRSGSGVAVAALRRLTHQMNYAGPDADADEAGTTGILRQLDDNELQAKAEAEHLGKVGDVDDAKADTIEVMRALVTPAGTYFYGPDREPLNRVLRKHADRASYFLRVLFTDEDGDQLRPSGLVSCHELYQSRFKKVLREGISICGRVYQFLGFSHSSLRAQSVWFMAPFVHNGSLVHAADVIRNLGDFSAIRIPAKCAARIGQAFSETPTAVTIDPRWVVHAEDVQRSGRVFSDGVGTISPSVMQLIRQAIKTRDNLPQPTCFQIRYAGAKGMMSLDTHLAGTNTIKLRPSMVKFPSPDDDAIEICAAVRKPLPLFLNRQVIKLLEDLGVPASAIFAHQEAAVTRLRSCTRNAANASALLRANDVGGAARLPWLLTRIDAMGLAWAGDRFLRAAVETTALLELRELKYRARIPVPAPAGYTLYGIMDETGVLREGEVFCIVDAPAYMPGGGTGKKVLTAPRVTVTRPPPLHPGDVQIAAAVAVPAGSPLMALSNCICFSQHGARDLPSMLSGGDLDGDLYNVIFDARLLPRRTYKAADYPRAAPLDIGRAVTRDDMTDFFVDFMENDNLGLIATLHQALADQRPEGTLHPDCLLLADLHSTAVDFSKTGIRADRSMLPLHNRYRPDFMSSGPEVIVDRDEVQLASETGLDGAGGESRSSLGPMTSFNYYESDKLLGRLFRAIDEKQVWKEMQANSSAVANDGGGFGGLLRTSVLGKVWRYVERKCDGVFEDPYLDWAHRVRESYESRLLEIMSQFSMHPQRPLSELEVLVGNTLGRAGTSPKRQREQCISMKDEWERNLHNIVRAMTACQGTSAFEAIERPLACFRVALDRDYDDSDVDDEEDGGPDDKAGGKKAGRKGSRSGKKSGAGGGGGGPSKRGRWRGRGQPPLRSFAYVAAAVCLKEVDDCFG